MLSLSEFVLFLMLDRGQFWAELWWLLCWNLFEFAPQGLKQVITGGILPISNGCTADVVYRACYEHVICHNEKYYGRFPQDVEIVREVVIHLGASSRWSANRIVAEDNGKFDAINTAKEDRPVYFTGEVVFPWMFDEIHALRQFKDAANILAEKEGWPSLYDVTGVNNNKVPVAAAVYYEDMYVNFKLAMETAPQIAGIVLWITNEYMHSGLRDVGSRVLEHLLGMLNGKKPLF